MAYFCPTLTLAMCSEEADEAHRLMSQMEDLGDEACGSPAHLQTLDEWAAFVARVARDNAARGDLAGWNWAPTWRLRPPPPPPTMTAILLRELGGLAAAGGAMVWRRLRPARPPAPPPERAAVIPIRREGGR